MGLAAAIARADLPFDAALRRVVEEAQPFIGADRATIRLLREEGAEVETTFVLGDPTGIGQPGGRVAAAADADWCEIAEQWNKLEPPQVLASARALHVPVEIDGAVAGSVSFEHGDDDQPWPPGAMEVARIAGGLVAMAECQRVHRAHEQANRVRQQIHDAIVDVARDFIFVVDRALRVSYVNAYAAAAVGREPSEIVGASLDQVFPPSTSERQQSNLRKVFETGSPLYVETETPFAGTSRWLDTWLLPLRADDGTVHSVVGISRDTTDRKRTEQALRTSEASYRTLIDLSPDSISLTDLEGRFLLVNRRGLEMNGAASLEELVAQHRTAFDVIAPEDRARAIEYAQKTLAEGQVTNLEYRLLRRDGSVFPAELNAAVVPDDQGKPKALIAIVRDVSARRQTEHALAGEKERLLVTLASIAEGVVTTDVDGRVELLNRVAEQLTGWSVDEARGRPL
jgi:PAS domain S-box-containing protein